MKWKPMRGSLPMPTRTCSMSAPTRSAMLAISLMKEILVASIALAAYLVSSAERSSIRWMRSWLRLNGAYIRRSVVAAASLPVPMMMRSGRMQSLTASPSFRNSGLDTTSNATSTPRAASSAAIAARTRAAVPTGTVDLLTITAGATRWRPMVRATASTWPRSAAPSSPGGVPTAMNTTSPCAMPSAASAEKRRRPSATLCFTIGARPGSKIGTSPARSAATLASSMSMQSTSWPTSARQVPVTRPT
jgi:hypothetical protein